MKIQQINATKRRKKKKNEMKRNEMKRKNILKELHFGHLCIKLIINW